jgi:lipoprotein-releasing system permease protein
MRSSTRPTIHLPFPLFVALRSLRSRRNRGFISFITGIAIVGVMLGVAALIIALSILSGFERTISENLIGFTSHMQLFAFQNAPLEDVSITQQRVTEKFPGVRHISPYVTGEAMVKSDRSVDGVLVKGIDPWNDWSPARERIVDGMYDLAVRESGLQPVIVGKRLTEKLGLSVGDRVLLMAFSGAQMSLAQARVMQFEISGVYETGMAEYDETYVYLNIRNAQRLFQLGSRVSGFDILVHDVTTLSELTAEIPAELGYPYYARSMYQTHRNLFTWIELQKKPVPIILGLIMIVATVNIIGTILMMVMEKTKEIGILRSLGAEARTLVKTFLFQGMFIGLIGTVLGNLLALALLLLEMRYKLISLPSDIYFMSHVPVELSFANFGLVSAAALAMCFLSSLLPSRVAAKLDPIRTLRFA